MKIAKDSWHCKVYQWWYTHKYPEKLRDYQMGSWDPTLGHFEVICTEIKMQQYSNLCPYMRAVMFWAPMRAVTWSWIKIGKVPLNAITIPAVVLAFPFLFNSKIEHRLFLVYLILLGICGGVALVAGLIALVVKNVPWIKKVFTPVAVQYGPPVASFGKLIHEYLRSFHDRICPEVDWREE